MKGDHPAVKSRRAHVPGSGISVAKSDSNATYENAAGCAHPLTLNSAYATTCSITRPPVSVNLMFRPAL